jgi:CBS domain-containing membrane protein
MSFRNFLSECRLLFGINHNSPSHAEKWISGLGGFLGILAVYWITSWCFPNGFMHTAGTLLMVTSMGATAVLLFAVPQGVLSQPWSVIGGHLLSAFVGVSCHQLFPDQTWTGALAVGLSILVMHYARAMHPPGGATALAAVIGGAEIHRLGYFYLIMPIGINILAILLMAIAFNALFHWRRYPAHLIRKQTVVHTRPYPHLTPEDFSAAIEKVDSFIDVSHETLMQLLEYAREHSEHEKIPLTQLEVGSFYSNGKWGNEWSVRRVIDMPAEKLKDKDIIIYKTVAGADSFNNGKSTFAEFRNWASHQVMPLENGHWKKIDSRKIVIDDKHPNH